ncbi:MAG TPA: ROK family transcriptional regulator [Geminicoccaceae bacterium]
MSPGKAAPAASLEERGDDRRGTSQAGMRLYNERLALSLIRRRGSLPKAEIARLTGLSAQTCSVIVKQLEADGLLRKEAPQRGRVGQPSVPFSLDPDGAFSLGLKIGRRSADLVLIDFVGGERARRRQSYRYPEPGPLLGFVGEALPELEGALRPAQRSRIAGLGVAMPWQIWSWQQEIGAPQAVLDQWRDLVVADELGAVCPHPLTVYNDATAACAAELAFGGGGRFRDFLYVFVGSFIGGGVVLDGKLLTGRTGNAGALGSMPVPAPDGGLRQLLQQASLFILERRLEASGFDPRRLELADAAWDEASPLVETWLNAAAAAIATAIVSAVAVLDLGTVVLDGGFPPAIRARLGAAVRDALGRLDRQGLSEFELIEGTLGAGARALGGAALPLLANFAIDSELLLKDGV